MSLSRRIAVLALALGWLAAPAWATAQEAACASCCAPALEAPCEPGATSCDTLEARACCDAPPTAPPPLRERTADAPSLDSGSAALAAPLPAGPARALCAQLSRADLAPRRSPLRLSVVLQR